MQPCSSTRTKNRHTAYSALGFLKKPAHLHDPVLDLLIWRLLVLRLFLTRKNGVNSQQKVQTCAWALLGSSGMIWFLSSRLSLPAGRHKVPLSRLVVILQLAACSLHRASRPSPHPQGCEKRPVTRIAMKQTDAEFSALGVRPHSWPRKPQRLAVPVCV